MKIESRITIKQQRQSKTGKRFIVNWEDAVEAKEFTALGISSHENDYRLSWCLNKELGLALAQKDNGFINNKEVEFACFVHSDNQEEEEENNENQLWLIANRCENGILLKKYKNLDFILKFNRKLSEEEKNEWIQKLRKASLVSAVFELPALADLSGK